MTDQIPFFGILRWTPALAWMAGIFWLSSQRALPPPPALSYAIAAISGHFVLYAVLAALVLVAVGAPRRLDRKTVAIVVLACFGYALSDEYHQSFVPGREPSLVDLIVDAAGITFTLAVWALGWKRFGTS